MGGCNVKCLYVDLKHKGFILFVCVCVVEGGGVDDGDM